MIGSAVKGGDFYGTVPTHVLNGPDDPGQDGAYAGAVTGDTRSLREAKRAVNETPVRNVTKT